ncbi:Kv channel-interacting protein 2 [Trichinella zimbabwensis]|uniref:Kv channel-interacting protein 2 n=1 Tax=Trichinella zimbabwensis TaxID=268475 RepID=A0A0V1HCU7_9BILA|nr:Kv channel-interacting protein 2 [Trichinella zimbabwensis]KRZ08475.1 Kv channel-interacting protein 2 [Trichinella zimbabwensis]
MGSYLAKELAKIARAKENFGKEIYEPIRLNLLPPEELACLFDVTRQIHELSNLYNHLKQAFPNGIITRKQFRRTFAEVFPNSVSFTYADNIFNSLGGENSDYLELLRIMVPLSKLYYGTTEDKIRWLFHLYDFNKDQVISDSDLLVIVTSIYELNGVDVTFERNQTAINWHIKQILAVISKFLQIQYQNSFLQKLDERGEGAIGEQQFIDVCMQDMQLLHSISSLDWLIL